MKRWMWLCITAIVAGCTAYAQPESATITLEVDAREMAKYILHIREQVPAGSEAMTLRFAKWIPGEHGPSGPIEDVAGLRITANGNPVRWRRDPEDLYAFTVDTPPDAGMLEVSFDFLLAGERRKYPERITTTPHLAFILWHEAVLYPAGAEAADIMIAPSLRIPTDWRWASSLQARRDEDGYITFETVPLETLVDSPVLTGRFMRAYDLAPQSDVGCTLHVASDVDSCLRVHPERLAAYQRLVEEARMLFGAPPFDRYELLVSLSDLPTQLSKEHRKSSECLFSLNEMFDSPTRNPAGAFAIAHEYVHAWNGKYRIPTGMLARDFSATMHFDLLWIYEGLTTYLGWVLMARSGLLSPAQFKRYMLRQAYDLSQRSGRTWRSLEDVSIAAPLGFAAREDWADWRRPLDFYYGAALLWFEVDAIIRERTANARSLDDFCQSFFRCTKGEDTQLPYTMIDVVACLDSTCEWDWNALFKKRVYDVDATLPQDGFERGGWSLVLSPAHPVPESAITLSAANDGAIPAALLRMPDKPDYFSSIAAPRTIPARSAAMPGSSRVAEPRTYILFRCTGYESQRENAQRAARTAHARLSILCAGCTCRHPMDQ